MYWSILASELVLICIGMYWDRIGECIGPASVLQRIEHTGMYLVCICTGTYHYFMRARRHCNTLPIQTGM